jgi:tetratricopeptide (TPR) repeat protein
MLYRGARLDTEEFENLKANNTNYISLNGFLSTTYSRDIALIYVGTSTTTKHAVLFEIECNAAKLTNRMIFADVSRFSDFPDEEEVLFDLGAAFKILSIKEDKDLNVWIVKMEANDEIAQFGKLYFENIISHGDDATVAIMFGILVNRMGKHDFSFRYFQCLLDNPEGEDLARIYNEMGSAWRAKGDMNKAFECYERSYELMMNSTPPRVKDSVRPLHNMANIFSNRKQYDKALLLLFHVLEIDKKYHGEEYLNSAVTLDAIGVLCFNNQAYKNALFYFEKSLEIRKKHLSNTHLEVAGSLQRIGGVYEQMNERKRAFQFYTEALLIRRRLLPDWHANVRESFMSSWNIIFYDEDYLHNMIERLVTGVRNAIMNEDSVDDTPTNDRDHITRTWLDKYSDDTESYYHFLNMVFE